MKNLEVSVRLYQLIQAEFLGLIWGSPPRKTGLKCVKMTENPTFF
jgi:hypothetical protein